MLVKKLGFSVSVSNIEIVTINATSLIKPKVSALGIQRISQWSQRDVWQNFAWKIENLKMSRWGGEFFRR